MSVAVIGAGAWGTALAKVLAEAGRSVTLWCREPDVLASLERSRVNERFLPEIVLPDTVRFTGDLERAADGAREIVLAIPSQFLRASVGELTPHVHREQLFVSAAKGIEDATLLRMSQVIEEALGLDVEVGAISGPTFAREVATHQPTALVAASRSLSVARHIQKRFSSERFRIYANDDLVGVELGGAVKNVIAIAAGVATGLGLGYNPSAALMTRGLAELSRLAVSLGGRQETLAGLAGLGDLVLTCTGALSRNRRVGLELGRGKSLDEIVSSMDAVAEGVRTTHAVVALARAQQVEMPITFQVDRLLAGKTSPEAVMQELMTRPLKDE